MPTSFSPELAAQLPGPDWLRAARTAAIERFAASELPTTGEEEWRYGPIDDFDLNAYVLAAEPSPATSAAAPDRDAAATVRLVNGRVTAIDVADGWAAKGLRVVALSQADAPERASMISESPDAFVDLNEAFAVDPVLVEVPANVDITEPVVVSSTITGDGVAAFTRLLVRVGGGAEVTVVEERSSTGHNLLVPVTELRADRGGRLNYVELQQLGADTWQLGTLAIEVEQEATVRAAVSAFGGSYARLRTDCSLIGRGASAQLLGASFADGTQTLDFRTFQHHLAQDTISDLLYVGAGAGTSKSIYTGTIHVGENGRGTNATQTNRNIKLSEAAWCESVPNLEIENNDVKCSHASAVGPVDEDQRFYLESRGVPPQVAERLIVAGFFDTVIEVMPVASMRDDARAHIAAKLEAAR